MAMAAEPEPSVPPDAPAPLGVSRPAPRRKAVARRDPLAAVLALGRREVRIGMAIGLAGALFVHGAGAGTAARQLPAMEAFARDIRTFVLDSLFSQYDIDVIKPPPPPPPAPDKPAPEEEAQKPVAKAPDRAPTQAEEKPPEAAQAGRVLTAEPDPNEPLDFTRDGFVTGNADHYAGGETTSTGTADQAVRDRRAKPGGVKGGQGSGPVQAAAPTAAAVDLSRPAMPLSTDWNCQFPAQADTDQIDFARVMVVVTVGPDGRAKSVVVASDPGHGFGAAAQRCAMGQQYSVALDSAGKPVTRTTPPFSVRFTR
jgi:periplasmic protein TonB